VSQSFEVLLVKEHLVVVINLLDSVEILVLNTKVIFKNIGFPLSELFSHGQLFRFLFLTFGFVTFRLRCLSRHIRILILQYLLLVSFVKIVENEFFKYLIFLLRIAEFFGH
jgi:hypothetical protein